MSPGEPVKKIIVHTSAKNEGDLVESFCRHSLTFCDAVLLNTGAQEDDTQTIIDAMIAEGLPIIPYSFTPPAGGNYDLHMRHWIDDAFTARNADLLLHLDPDEFLFHVEGKNPREELERLAENEYHQFPWRSYVYAKDPDDDAAFLPSFFTEYRTGDPFYAKTCISRYLFERFRPLLGPGHHSLRYTVNQDQARHISERISDRLAIGHFPIRSLTQTMIKIMSGMVAKWAARLGPQDAGYQWDAIYELITRNRGLTPELVRECSLFYSVISPEERGKIGIAAGSLPVDYYPEAMRLKYTRYGRGDRDYIVLHAVMSRAAFHFERVHQQSDAKLSALTAELGRVTHAVRSWAHRRPTARNESADS